MNDKDMEAWAMRLMAKVKEDADERRRRQAEALDDLLRRRRKPVEDDMGLN